MTSSSLEETLLEEHPIVTNRERLVRMSVTGQVTHPRLAGSSPYRISIHGEPCVLPATGGVTYNIRVGHPVIDIVGDHVEPAVSMKNRDEPSNGGLNVLACVGNVARVLGGAAKGSTGVVTGKHGGAEHVMVDFSPEVLEVMIPGDHILVKSFGTGLQLPDFPDIKCMSLDPDFFEAWITETRAGKLVVPVTHLCPAKVMGSGLGRDNAFRGDYDITMFDNPVALLRSGIAACQSSRKRCLRPSLTPSGSTDTFPWICIN